MALLAETFTDPEAYQGTCYKASAWEPVGTSQGYDRHRGDVYREHGKPKHLWLLRPLHPSAKALLSAPDPALPEDCRAGLRRAPTGTLPLKNGQLPSLLEALCGVPDPRAKNTRFKIGPVLGLVALALLAGRRDIASIARMANLLDQDQRFALALPREAGKKVRLAPSYSVFYDVLTRLDPEAFAQAHTTVGSQPTPVPCPERSPWTKSLSATRSGCSAWSRPTPARRSPWPSSIKRKTPRAVNRPAPVRCWPPRRWTSRSSHRRRLARHPRAGPHHRGKRRRVCAPDQRQPTPAERAGPARPDRSTPFFELTDPSRDRVTTWRVSVVVATPSQADYPGLRSLVLVDKTTVRKRDLPESCEQRAYASSLAPAERSPAQMLALIRGHWGGVEIRNHWRRDACWRKDHSRTRNVTPPGQPRPLAQRPAARLRQTLARAAPAARLRILPTFHAYLPARHPFPFLKQKPMA
ncbi:MAG: transposase family protein [Candidatus Synoicihabitans palmerolidicus]|nr:transposase family protein [Candidatus Synoicihabitans palmerolidicus]